MIVPENAITGSIVLPEGTVMPEGAVWSVELQDTSLADVPAVTVGLDGGLIEDLTATQIPYIVEYEPTAIDDSLTYTLNAQVFDADGNPLFINDTSTPGIVDGEPVEDVQVEVIDIPALEDSET